MPGNLAARLAAQAESTTRRAPPRFEPGSKHRDELIASLAPEQRPIAERLAAGGVPAVRRAVAEERERARAEGRPEATGEAILTLAEQLAPSVKQAIWLDRAEAALAQLDRISLRDLRTTVVAATPRDETARELDRKLREELDRRVTKLRSNWEEQITHALEEGRVLQALRLSAQPPEPTARFPAGLVERLASSAGAAMTSGTPTERWLAILDAADILADTAADPPRRSPRGSVGGDHAQGESRGGQPSGSCSAAGALDATTAEAASNCPPAPPAATAGPHPLADDRRRHGARSRGWLVARSCHRSGARGPGGAAAPEAGSPDPVTAPEPEALAEPAAPDPVPAPEPEALAEPAASETAPGSAAEEPASDLEETPS